MIRKGFRFDKPLTIVSMQPNTEIDGIVRTKNQKSRLVLTVQAFCEEKGLRSLSGVFG